MLAAFFLGSERRTPARCAATNCPQMMSNTKSTRRTRSGGSNRHTGWRAFMGPCTHDGVPASAGSWSPACFPSSMGGGGVHCSLFSPCQGPGCPPTTSGKQRPPAPLSSPYSVQALLHIRNKHLQIHQNRFCLCAGQNRSEGLWLGQSSPRGKDGSWAQRWRSPRPLGAAFPFLVQTETRN